MIQFWNVSKSFVNETGKAIHVLESLDLTVAAQEFVCLLGQSGCGKSTLLGLAAGLIPPDRGRVQVLGNCLSGTIQEAQMVFQEYSLLPWRNVLDNVALSMELQGVGRAERRQKAQTMLDQFGLGSFANSYPHELSGGMRQRAAIARAMTTEPQILYMDEPFGALDAHTRMRMQEELLRFWLDARRTVLFVTHSVEEAVFLGNRVVVLGGRPGTIQEDISISLAYPRDRWSPEFGSYCRHLLDALDRSFASAT